MQLKKYFCKEYSHEIDEYYYDVDESYAEYRRESRRILEEKKEDRLCDVCSNRDAPYDCKACDSYSYFYLELIKADNFEYDLASLPDIITRFFRYPIRKTLVEFNFLRMVRHHRKDLFVTTLGTKQERDLEPFLSEILATMKDDLHDDSTLWKLLASLGINVTQQEADLAVPTKLSGYAYCLPSFQEGHTDLNCRYPILCVDPAFTLGFLARVTGKFYRSQQRPDYSLHHLLYADVICDEPRIPAEYCSTVEN